MSLSHKGTLGGRREPASHMQRRRLPERLLCRRPRKASAFHCTLRTLAFWDSPGRHCFQSIVLFCAPRCSFAATGLLLRSMEQSVLPSFMAPDRRWPAFPAPPLSNLSRLRGVRDPFVTFDALLMVRKNRLRTRNRPSEMQSRAPESLSSHALFFSEDYK